MSNGTSSTQSDGPPSPAAAVPVAAVNKYKHRTIDVDAVPRADQIDLLRDALVGANETTKTYYVEATGRQLCRIDFVSGKPIVEPVELAALNEIAVRLYCWVRVRKNEEGHCDPPGTVVRAVADHPGAELPRLRGIVDAPYMTRSGRVIDRVGYDDETENYLHLDQQLDPIPETPSDEQLAGAVKLLVDDALDGFVFSDAASKSNTVAAGMTPHLLTLYPGLLTPIFAIDAADNNFGKTSLAQSIMAPFVGHEPPVTNMTTTDGTECRRTIFALLRGVPPPPSIILDNVSTTIAGDAIAAVKTSRYLADRQIKSSTAPAAENTAIWFATGTLMTFSREMAIRSVLVQLAAPPIGRRNSIQWAIERRLEILRAQLIVMRRWITAGRPLANIKHPKYPRWAELVGAFYT